MSRLNRIQVVFQTKEGEVVTSTQLVINDAPIECIPLASFIWLMQAEYEDRPSFLARLGLITYNRSGIEWLSCYAVLPHLSLTMK
jgi:hypothetical protein